VAQAFFHPASALEAQIRRPAFTSEAVKSLRLETER